MPQPFRDYRQNGPGLEHGGAVPVQRGLPSRMHRGLEMILFREKQMPTLRSKWNPYAQRCLPCSAPRRLASGFYTLSPSCGVLSEQLRVPSWDKLFCLCLLCFSRFIPTAHPQGPKALVPFERAWASIPCNRKGL